MSHNYVNFVESSVLLCPINNVLSCRYMGQKKKFSRNSKPLKKPWYIVSSSNTKYHNKLILACRK